MSVVHGTLTADRMMLIHVSGGSLASTDNEVTMQAAQVSSAVPTNANNRTSTVSPQPAKGDTSYSNSCKMPRGIPNAKREDLGMRYTSFNVPLL